MFHMCCRSSLLLESQVKDVEDAEVNILLIELTESHKCLILLLALQHCSPDKEKPELARSWIVTWIWTVSDALWRILLEAGSCLLLSNQRGCVIAARALIGEHPVNWMVTQLKKKLGARWCSTVDQQHLLCSLHLSLDCSSLRTDWYSVK